MRSREKGFALILALWMLLLLSVIGAGLLLEARAVRRSAATDFRLLQAREIADGAINRILLSFFSPQDEIHPTLDGKTIEMRLFDQTVLIRAQSEFGKINLNFATEATMETLLSAAGARQSDAHALAERIVAWRSPLGDAEQDGESVRYRNASLSYGPRFGPFRSEDELRLVLGMTDSLQASIAPLITVWSPDGTIDRAVAPTSLLQVLGAGGDGVAESQLAAREEGHAAGADRIPAIGEPITISARLETGDLIVERRAVVQIGGSQQQPFRILSWR